MFLHELRHIDAHHGAVIIKQKLCHGFGQLGFAHTRWAEKQERPKWTVLVIQPSAGTAHGIRQGTNRRRLPDYTTVQMILHPQQFLAVTFQHLGGRNTSPALNYACDLFGAHGLCHHSFAFAPLGLNQQTF